MAAKQPDLDETTLQIMKRMVNTPPKPHDEMKVGKHGVRGRKAPNPASAMKKNRSLALGFLKDESAVPDEVRLVMRANSRALGSLTMKSPC
jgi:hypothetical protein